ncbi:Na+-driven multidrug efflux pump [Staphylococcus saprophyticus]
MGLCEGVVPLIAYNFMSDKARMKNIIKVVIMTIVVIFAVCMVIVFTTGHQLIGIFSNDAMATFMLKVTMTSLLLNGIGFLFTGMLQATGQGRGATIMAILQSVVIIPVLFVMNGLFGLTGIVWSLLIAETICALAAMLIVYLLRDRLTVDKAELLEG